MIATTVVWVVGLALIFTSGWGLPHTQGIEAESSLRSVAGKILFSVGYGAWFAVGLVSAFKIRCPRCGKRLGWVRKKWKYCLFCGVSLDSQLEGTK
jgi:hypothetical protein